MHRIIIYYCDNDLTAKLMLALTSYIYTTIGFLYYTQQSTYQCSCLGGWKDTIFLW